MLICGLQKLSMVDYPEKLAATIFTGGCNLRCPFCHNAPLVLNPEGEPRITENGLFEFLEKRKGILDALCVSGGEPLQQHGILKLLERVRMLDSYLIKLDTNGCFPKKLKEIVGAGLVDYVAMDIKASPLKYSEAVGIVNFDLKPVFESASFLMDNNVKYEFRTTLTHELHSVSDAEVIGCWLEGAKSYYLQTYVDSGNTIGSAMHAFTAEETNGFKNILERHIQNVTIRG